MKSNTQKDIAEMHYKIIEIAIKYNAIRNKSRTKSNTERFYDSKVRI